MLQDLPSNEFSWSKILSQCISAMIWLSLGPEEQDISTLMFLSPDAWVTRISDMMWLSPFPREKDILTMRQSLPKPASPQVRPKFSPPGWQPSLSTSYLPNTVRAPNDVAGDGTQNWSLLALPRIRLFPKILPSHSLCRPLLKFDLNNAPFGMQRRWWNQPDHVLSWRRHSPVCYTLAHVGNG